MVCGPGLPISRGYAHVFTYTDMRQEPLLLTAISRRIAQRFDMLASSLCSEKVHDTCNSLHHYYGPELFCCPIPSCSRHGHGFETRDKRESHAAKHQRLVKCGVADCEFSSIGFESESDRANHMLNCHNLAQQAEITWEDMDDKASPLPITPFLLPLV